MLNVPGMGISSAIKVRRNLRVMSAVTFGIHTSDIRLETGHRVGSVSA
jgi:hypothetical protein